MFLSGAGGGGVNSLRVGLRDEIESVVKVLMSRMQRPTRSTNCRIGTMQRSKTHYQQCSGRFSLSYVTCEKCVCHLRRDAAFLDLFVDECGTDEADEAAHSGTRQTQNRFH